jgi:hypothetical protein
MNQKVLPVLLILFLPCLVITCSDEPRNSVSEVTVTISVTDDVVVNGDTVAIDSLEMKLSELGATSRTNIRVVPDPEAGAGTIERVQRKIRVYKQTDH